MRRAKRDSRRITYMFRVPMIMRGASLSLLPSARSDCDFAGVPATKKSCGNPPAGGCSVTFSPSRCRMARWAGPFARRMLLSSAEPTELSPGCSHSSPTSESQASGFNRSAACWVRQVAKSLWKVPSWASSEAASRRAATRAVSQRENRSSERIGKYNSGIRIRENTDGIIENGDAHHRGKGSKTRQSARSSDDLFNACSD